jgi:hypothetical protein
MEDKDSFKLEELTSYSAYIALRNKLQESKVLQ